MPPASLPGYAIEVYTRDPATGDPVLRYSRAAGSVGAAGQMTTAAVDSPMRTASAAKTITALLVAHAATQPGVNLPLNTTVAILGCPGLTQAVQQTTLGAFMHQIAGIRGLDEMNDNPCLTDSTVSLHDCACSILSRDLVYPPNQFRYDGMNFTVAAAMADKALAAAGQVGVRRLFTSLTAAVGIPAGQAALTLANDFGGGDDMSARAYALLLSVATPGPYFGMLHGQRLYDATLLSDWLTPFDDTVQIAYSPYTKVAQIPLRYGFGGWVQCSDRWGEPAQWPALGTAPFTLDYQNCPYKVGSSLGKFGYMPWVSVNGQYAAVVATYNGTGANLVSANSFLVYTMLDPVLRGLLAN
jgi:hypothetical protein